MAWFGEGLSTLKGQITNFTKEVLSEAKDEVYDTNSELTASKKKVEELEALCASQDLEISELKQRNAELQRRLGEDSHTDDGWQIWEPPKSVFEKQDDLANAKQELAEKTQLVDVFRQQLDNLKLEKQHVSARCSQLEKEVQKLSEQLQKQTESSELENVESQLKVATDQVSQTRDENVRVLKEQLRVAEMRIEELEKEVQSVHQQMLEQLSDSQMNTSEIRGEVEQTRWQLLHESGTQKTELLRARQDMVNRIIQMGEKSREVEMNMKKLQRDGKHLTTDITAIIHKLGDPEQQELIHGTLKALELENQVLKLRNAQLELAGNTETLKGSRKCEEADVNTKHQDTVGGKLFDDFDTASLKSEVSELSQLRQKLEDQVAELEKQVDKYERDIECFESMRTDWSEEKQQLEQNLKDMKQQLKEKEEKLNLLTAQKGLIELRKQTPDENLKLQKRVQEMNSELSCLKEEKEQLLQGKICLSSELEAMAKIVQDLESQLAKAQEENAGLTQNLEELDEQHQGAIDQLLNVKQSLQKQNEALQFEVDSLRKQDAGKTDASTECSEPTRLHNASQTKDTSNLHEECKKNLEAEFQEKISNLITFEIPQNYFNLNNNNDVAPMGTIEALVKMCVECKWKKDTLERKVAELMKELRESKLMFEERDRMAKEMENECKVLKGNVETLIEDLMVSKSGSGEALAPIPENSEEAEMMEQRIISLENEVEVLREARSNLEADAKKLREQEQVLIMRIEMTSAALRNQENLETELKKSQEMAAVADAELQQLRSTKQLLEEEITELKSKVEENASAILHQENLKAELTASKEIETTTNLKLQEAISANQLLEEQLNKLKVDAELSFGAERDELQGKINEFQMKLESVQKDLLVAEQTVHSLKNEKEVIQKQLEKEQALKKEYEDICKNSHVSKEVVENQEELLTKIAILQQAIEVSKAEKKKLEETCHESHVLKDALRDQEEIKVAILNKTVELEEARLKISEYEKLSLKLQEELNVYVKDFQSAKGKLDDLETQLESTLKSRTAVEEELSLAQTTLMGKYEEISELKLVIENLSAAQDSYNLLQIEFNRKEAEVKDLKAEKLSLEERLRRAEAECQQERTSIQDHEAMALEIKKWKEMAEGSERQLNEVLQVRAELEQECGRLYSIETKVQNQEHLVRELHRLRETCEELDQKYNDLLSEKKNLEARCSDQAAQISEVEIIKQDALEKAKEVQEKFDVTLQQMAELEIKCQAMESADEKLKSLEKENIKRKEFIVDLNHELREAIEAKSNLEMECKRLLAVEGKLRNQENLEAEVKELREKLATSELKLSETVETKQLESMNKATHSKTENASQIGNFELQIERQEELLEVQNLLTERQRILAVLDEKTRENGLLKAENSRLLEVITQQESTVAKLKEEHEFQNNEAAQMTKETVGNLSKMIKDKDMELEALKQKSETLLKLLQDSSGENNIPTDVSEKQEVEKLKQELERLNKERAELIMTVQMKHQESLQYHAEIQRLSALLNEEIRKQSLTQLKDNSVSQKEGETEQLPDDLHQQIEKLQAECLRMADSLLQEQTRNKYLQNEVQEQYEKETALQKKLDRLREHLVEVEDIYTQETLKAEEYAKDLQNKLAQAEEQIKNSSTAYTSASIRANQHVESLQGQARLIAQQRDEIQQKLSASEDMVQHHTAALRNLQIVLEQFQRDKEREISAATEKLHQQLQAEQRKQMELQAEIAALQVQLSEAKEGLSAGVRLGEQLEKKSKIIASLREEVTKLTTELQEAEGRVQSASLNVEGKVDRYLVKNLVLGYFIATPNTRNQVLRIVANVLDFNQDERDRVGLDSASSSSGWFKSILHPGKGPANMQSLSEAFVRFLENESRPQPQLRLLPEGQESTQGNSRSESPSSSAGGSQRRSPLLLSEVQLPTFTQFPVGRNSSSILKDVLKDS